MNLAVACKVPHSAPGHQLSIELGANWVHGTQQDGGPANPIYELALKHNLNLIYSDEDTTTYDMSGAVDYMDDVNNAMDAFSQLTVAAGARIPPKTPREMASEYFMWDFTYAQTPEQSSFLASSWAWNFTYIPDQGGFSEDNLLSIDQRGFKYFIQAEAAEFLTPSPLRLQSTVTKIEYSDSAVSVTLADGTSLTAPYAICTFSVGVLQNDDVQFDPPMPEWKVEAVHSTTMFAIYADIERGKYSAWQTLDHKNFLPGSGVLFATVSVMIAPTNLAELYLPGSQGDFSKRIEAMTDAQVQAEVMEVLRTMYPKVTIPEPTGFLFPRWLSDPLFRGSISNWAPSFIPQHVINLGVPLGRLWFAGEATSERYFGYLHGAYFEGEVAASQIAQCIKGNLCYPDPPILNAQNSFAYNL
ncbi:hypothetical protein EI94DRAFT_1807680 [Lactarius quietus]|nr:hypothetical protein EI94DRAFT_1807680 [Lactarius quietus]